MGELGGWFKKEFWSGAGAEGRINTKLITKKLESYLPADPDGVRLEGGLLRGWNVETREPLARIPLLYGENGKSLYGVNPDAITARFRDRTGAQLLGWFEEARADLLNTFATLDPRARLPWFGPPMSAASSLTARIMETWAHTQDIADALGVSREPTSRLRHVAHIGVGARAFSYAVHGRTPPAVDIRVELAGPDGTVWTWGPAEAENRVTGPALDFCLLVTQRRHRDDLALDIEGPAATEWMSIAQAFAGAAGTGRPRATHA